MACQPLFAALPWWRPSILLYLPESSSFRQDEASNGLKEPLTREGFKRYGSSYVARLAYRDMWAMVAQKISGKAVVHAEGFETTKDHFAWSAPVVIRTMVQTQPDNSLDCPWNRREDIRRLDFCAKYEGYGKTCACEFRYLLPFAFSGLEKLVVNWCLGGRKRRTEERTREQRNERSNEGTDERTNERTKGRRNERTNERTKGRTNEWAREQTNERRDGRTNWRTLTPNSALSATGWN